MSGISDVIPLAVFQGSGSRGPFSFVDGETPIPFAANGHLFLQRIDAAGQAADLELGVHYDLDVTLDSTTNLYSCEITLRDDQDVLAAASGSTPAERLAVWREQPLDQSLSIAYNASFPSTSFNRLHNRFVAIAQDLRLMAQSAVRVPRYEEGPDLRDALLRKGKVLAGHPSTGALSMMNVGDLTDADGVFLVHEQEFELDNGETEFTLTGVQLTDSAAAMIWIGGAYQPVSSYAVQVSGDDTIITLDAPIVGDGVEVLVRVLGGLRSTDTAVSTDGSLTANSDDLVPTQKAVKTYVDAPRSIVSAQEATEDDGAAFLLRNAEGIPRWGFFKNATSEDDGDVGSDLDLWSYDNAGGIKDLVARVSRATGVWEFLIEPVVPVTADGSPQARTLRARAADRPHLFDFVPPALHAAILAKTSTTAVSEYIDDAIAAMTAAGSANDRTLILPPGRICIDATVEVTQSNIRFRGQGGDPIIHAVGAQGAQAATEIRWVGAADGDMFSWVSPEGGSNQIIVGCGLEGVYLNPNSLAARGIVIRSVRGGQFRDILLYDFSGNAVDLGVVSALGDVESTQGLEFFNVIGRATAAAPNGNIFVLDGDYTTNANTSLCLFRRCRGVVYDGVVFDIHNADNNDFMLCAAQVTNTGRQIVFRGSNDNAVDVARGNSFRHFSPSGATGGIVAEGTDTKTHPSHNNRVQIDNENAPTLVPTVGTNARLRVDYLDSPIFNPALTTPGGRLTLTSGTPVPTGDVTAAASIYYTPSEHDQMAIFEGDADGAPWQLYTFTELTLALDSDSGHTGYHQSGKNFDIFVINDAGTLRLGTGPAWTNDTTRADAIARKNGVLTNNASIVIRFGSASGNTVTVAANKATYVGTMRASADGQCEDSAAKRFLWNMYNRRLRTMKVAEATDSWAYSTAAYQQANNSSANQLAYVVGLNEEAISAEVSALVSNSTSTARAVRVGIGIDSAAANGATAYDNVQVNTLTKQVGARYVGYPGLGYHYLAWLEWGGGSDTQTWLGDGATAAQSAIFGRLMG